MLNKAGQQTTSPDKKAFNKVMITKLWLPLFAKHLLARTIVQGASRKTQMVNRQVERPALAPC